MRPGMVLICAPLALIAQLAVAQAAAGAADCGPLKQINAVDLVRGPNRALIPVTINGTPELFLLDTGGDISQINSVTADALQLVKRDSNIKMMDLYGNASRKMVKIEKFGVGRLAGEYINMAIEPNPDFGNGTRYVGIFAPDLMGRYDVEIDFGTYKMNYFSPDHCPGHVIYWPHQALAIVPMTFHNRHIRLPVRIDGKELTAEIDTGAPQTMVTEEAARRILGITAESPGNVPLNTKTGAFGHAFSSLDFEGVAVTNPRVVILPNMVGKKDPDNGFRTETRAKMRDDLDDRMDMLIGMDVLKKLHLYIAFGESRIFISEASAPKPAADGGLSAAQDTTGAAP